MIMEFWNTFLYQPVFNLLIWIYSNWADGNMGWAIVYLTVLLRAALLPLTIVQFKKSVDHADLGSEVKKLEKEFHNDEVQKNYEIRRLLKKKKVNPWAKFVSLGIQGLVLVLLYQVFVNGITGEKMFKTLYYFVEFPGKINTMFYGFNLGMIHDVWWSGAVAVLLFAENYYDATRTKKKFSKADLSYFILFPLAVFFFLWILPITKSLFVLTSMVFSIIIGWILGVFIRPKKNPSA
jgi:YidC/Oxa1 family membrane protein insertase